MSPAIHFVVPFYGRVDYLAETVDSILAQDDPDWALTVVEDGAHDGLATPDWRARLADPRIQWLTNADRLGLAGNFQRALDLVEHAWCAFPGCDDVLEPSYVRAVRQVLTEHPDVDVVLPGVAVIDADGQPVRPLGDAVKSWLRRRHRQRVLAGEALAASLMHGNWLYFPALCWRSAAVKPIGFRQDLPTTLDLALTVKLVLRGGSLAVGGETAFRYRRHHHSVSSRAAQADDRFDEERRLLDQLAGELEAVGWTRAARAARWRLTSRLHGVLAGVARTRHAVSRRTRAAA